MSCVNRAYDPVGRDFGPVAAPAQLRSQVILRPENRKARSAHPESRKWEADYKVSK